MTLSKHIVSLFICLLGRPNQGGWNFNKSIFLPDPRGCFINGFVSHSVSRRPGVFLEETGTGFFGALNMSM